MDNDIINWPGNEPQDTDKQDQDNGTNMTVSDNEITPLDRYYVKSDQTSTSDSYRIEDTEWWLNRIYKDKNGIELNVVGLVLLAFGIIYFWQDTMYLFFILCLAINVLLHECGHYAAGRIFKCVVRKVSVFFVPAISYKNKEISFYDPARHSWRDTVWTLGVIPFGGYTSFESAKTPAPSDWRRSPFINHKPAWQRLIINTAGIIVNLLTFLACFAINGFSFATSGSPWLSTMMYLSLTLSIINILPLYPLDGSAAITSIYEIITGRKPSKTFMTVFMIVGGALLIYLFWINPTYLNKLITLIIGR